ncbi:hypothetical protein JTE90_003736 [Oedothorax gibbosus]|uniref:Ubiquitin-like domain-containing protein n=1 Tax=Oedothorax gibbosus TaxID=931172 RepID=A0AAV6V9X7_9ARAC|nr:hypothetical protein JTE90_003736 [Oedothorax gibbosus]
MLRTVLVRPSTGGQICVRMSADQGVDRLKATVADKLGLHRDKIVLLHGNRQLNSGSLAENDIPDGSKLVLLPNVETGITAQNPEQCVMQALETLDATQVENFLAGRLPLNLTMRLGDHMMFIQLQLAPPLPPTPPSSPLSKEAPRLDTPSQLELSEASRNLTRTLKQLSSVTMANKMKEECNGRCCVARREGGAVIESMLHHGRGVFSGTFSGTLSPGLQDGEGRPRRDICTVVHILNDLLGASSHCKPCSSLSSSNSAPSKRQDTPTTEGKRGDGNNDVLRAKVDRLRTLLRQRRRPYGRSQFSPAVA